MSLNDRLRRMNELIKPLNHPELKEEWYALRDELSAVRDQQREHEESKNLAKGLILKLNWYEDDTGRKFCMPCMDAEKGRFHLAEIDEGWQCPHCKFGIRPIRNETSQPESRSWVRKH